MKNLICFFFLAVWLFIGCVQTPPANPSASAPQEEQHELTNSFTPKEKRCLNFGPYEKGQSPKDDITLSPEQLTARLYAIKDYTAWIRTYGVTRGLEAIPRIAKDMGIKVAAGCWLSRDREANEREIESLITIGKTRQADLLVVGSETLLRKDLTSKDLITYIRRVKDAVVDIPVTTADAFDALAAYPEVIQACDILFCNIYPYWDGESIDCALHHFDKKFRVIEALSADRKIWISESGWPTDGNTVNEAKPNLENACIYIRQLVAWSQINDVPVFLFQAFDEDWKTIDEGPQGAHWGLFDAKGNLKPCMQTVFEETPTIQIWKDCTPVKPSISFTQVPKYGSHNYLQGTVKGIKPNDFRIVVLIRVEGVWWIKPFSNDRTIFIAPDGKWSTIITTGGNDELATEIFACVIPANYSPPDVLGWKSVPKELTQKAVAKTSIRRTPS